MKKILNYLIDVFLGILYTEEELTSTDSNAKHIVKILRTQFSEKDQNTIIEKTIEILIQERELDIISKEKSLENTKVYTQRLKELKSLSLVG